MRHIVFLIFCFFYAKSFASEKEWLIFRGNTLKEEDVKGFTLLILDVDDHTPLTSLKEEGRVFYGWVDLHSTYNRFKKSANPEKSYEWVESFLKETIPELQYSGFNGLYFHGTQELARELNTEKRTGYSAIVQLFLLIKIHFPDLPILISDDRYLLGEIGSLLKGILVEGLITRYNQSIDKYEFLPKKEQKKRFLELDEIEKKFPKLLFFSLNFWDPQDLKTIDIIYKKIEKREAIKVHPYVTNYQMTQVVKRS